MAIRAEAFQAAFGAFRGKLSGVDEFMACKTNNGFGSAQPTGFAQLNTSAHSTSLAQAQISAQIPISKRTAP